MKKIISVLVTVFMMILLNLNVFAFENESYYDVPELKGTSINVYNWGEYISEEDSEEDGLIDVNAAFEELTGIHVNYTNFASNEDLYAKLKSGGASYDVIIPSDYMVSRLIAEGLVQKIYPQELPNYKYVSEEYRGMYFDEKDEYSVAYSVGMVGLIYNREMVDEIPTSWSALWMTRAAGTSV